MSLARYGDATKTEDQERISRELAGHRGWAVSRVYTDNNKSAWQRNRKRPGWDAMLADVEAGKLGAIIVYHGDRLVRQPWDLETLINLAYGKGIKLASPTGERDLSNDDDLFILRIEVAAQCRESASTSRRKKTEFDRLRRRGLVRPGGRGGRAFGFATDGVTHIPAEVGAIQETAVRVLEGEAVGAIARDLNSAGIRTPTGGLFSHATLRKMLARPRYAGLMPDGVHTAAWKPVLQRQEWEAVTAALDTKAAGFGYATNARRYLLSGLAVCGACGATLQIRAERRPELSGYGCVTPGCRKVQRSVRLLDAYVTGAVAGQLGKAANPAGRIPQGRGVAAEFRALADQRTETEAMLRDHTKGRAELLMARLDSIDARLAELRALAAGDARSRLLDTHAGITREEFGALPLATRRALVSACYVVTVLPASKRGPGFRMDDVRLSPRDRI